MALADGDASTVDRFATDTSKLSEQDKPTVRLDDRLGNDVQLLVVIQPRRDTTDAPCGAEIVLAFVMASIMTVSTALTALGHARTEAVYVATVIVGLGLCVCGVQLAAVVKPYDRRMRAYMRVACIPLPLSQLVALLLTETGPNRAVMLAMSFAFAIFFLFLAVLDAAVALGFVKG